MIQFPSPNMQAMATLQSSLSLEQQDRNVTQVEVDEVFRLFSLVS